MIHVIASIQVKDGRLPEVLKIYETFAPEVHKEKGCRLYLPTLDYQTDIQTQQRESNCVTVIEKWESLAAFQDHLNAPHVVAFREEIKGIVENVSVKILKPAIA